MLSLEKRIAYYHVHFSGYTAMPLPLPAQHILSAIRPYLRLKYISQLLIMIFCLPKFRFVWGVLTNDEIFINVFLFMPRLLF